MKKISLLILLVCLVFSLLSLSAFAEDEVTAPEAETSAEAEKTASWSETVTAWLGDNLDSIFTGASLGGVAILMYLFKKGLLPAVSGAFVKIGDTVTAAKDKLGAVADETKGAVADFIEKFAPILEKVDSLSDTVDKSLAALQRANDEKDLLVSALEESSKLLVDMISASRLPESVKEAARLTKAKHDSLVDSLRSGGASE